MAAVFRVDTPAGVYVCDTRAEVATLRARHGTAQVRQLRSNPTSAEYSAGAQAARMALSSMRRNPSAALEHLQLHETYRIRGHRVRRVDEDHVVVDGVRMSLRSAARKVGAP